MGGKKDMGLNFLSLCRYVQYPLFYENRQKQISTCHPYDWMSICILIFTLGFSQTCCFIYYNYFLVAWDH